MLYLPPTILSHAEFKEYSALNLDSLEDAKKYVSDLLISQFDAYAPATHPDLSTQYTLASNLAILVKNCADINSWLSLLDFLGCELKKIYDEQKVHAWECFDPQQLFNYAPDYIPLDDLLQEIIDTLAANHFKEYFTEQFAKKKREKSHGYSTFQRFKPTNATMPNIHITVVPSMKHECTLRFTFHEYLLPKKFIGADGEIIVEKVTKNGPFYTYEFTQNYNVISAITKIKALFKNNLSKKQSSLLTKLEEEINTPFIEETEGSSSETIAPRISIQRLLDVIENNRTHIAVEKYQGFRHPELATVAQNRLNILYRKQLEHKTIDQFNNHFELTKKENDKLHDNFYDYLMKDITKVTELERKNQNSASNLQRIIKTIKSVIFKIRDYILSKKWGVSCFAGCVMKVNDSKIRLPNNMAKIIRVIDSCTALHASSDNEDNKVNLQKTLTNISAIANNAAQKLPILHKIGIYKRSPETQEGYEIFN